MSFLNVRDFADAMVESGREWTSFVHKTGGPASFGAGRWGDMSMGAGTPKYNAYVGSQNTATPLIGAGNDGIYIGPTPPAGMDKFLHEISLHSSSATLAPAYFVLCDYLMHYPLVDGDDTGQQDMDNTLTLPRTASGNGVMCFAVCTTPTTANATVQIRYTNSEGVSNRLSQFTLLTTSVVGTIMSSSNTSAAAGSASPFIPLADGDTGIRSIESVTNLGSGGGFFALVLVSPLAPIVLRQTGVAAEIQTIPQRGAMPKIDAGAYLNFIYSPGQSGTAVTLRGHLQFVWG